MLRNTFLNAQNGPITQLGKPGAFASYPRLRLLRWRDMINDQTIAPSTKFVRQSTKRNELALMTNPLKDLINLTAILPQANHRRTANMPASAIKKTRSLNDISNIYPSMYTSKEP